ncbi:MAG: methyltransferase domain-containing protein [Pirellulales bacterium]|nr:methyltransferase domain-containing protein [Pirellulales bacterium]
MRRSIAEHKIFWQELRRNFRHTGSVLPSGRFLSAALARYVRSIPGEKRILEVGPGTGVVTRAIVKRTSRGDHVDLVELNDRFVEILNGRIAHDSKFRRPGVTVRVFHSPVEQLQVDVPYDLIVSGLPLNNFDVATIETIFGAFERLCKPGGIVSFFEYAGVRPARALVGQGKDRDRFRAIHGLLRDKLRKHEIRREWIWPNVPPAWVHHMRLDEVVERPRRNGKRRAK